MSHITMKSATQIKTLLEEGHSAADLAIAYKVPESRIEGFRALPAKDTRSPQQKAADTRKANKEAEGTVDGDFAS